MQRVNISVAIVSMVNTKTCSPIDPNLMVNTSLADNQLVNINLTELVTNITKSPLDKNNCHKVRFTS
jgi:hypothetical protein